MTPKERRDNSQPSPGRKLACWQRNWSAEQIDNKSHLDTLQFTSEHLSSFLPSDALKDEKDFEKEENSNSVSLSILQQFQ